jgi:hypothetical protein
MSSAYIHPAAAAAGFNHDGLSSDLDITPGLATLLLHADEVSS